MSVTPEVSHALMSSLKDALAGSQFVGYAGSAQNRSFMLVTSDVSHAEMWPYVASAAAASASQASTAVLRLSLSSAEPRRRRPASSVAATAAARHRMHAKDAFISRKAAALPWGSPGSEVLAC